MVNGSRHNGRVSRISRDGRKCYLFEAPMARICKVARVHFAFFVADECDLASVVTRRHLYRIRPTVTNVQMPVNGRLLFRFSSFNWQTMMNLAISYYYIQHSADRFRVFFVCCSIFTLTANVKSNSFDSSIMKTNIYVTKWSYSRS